MKQFSIIIVFNEDGKVLFGRRNDSKLWTTPAGGVEDKETPLMGAVRELREETNIKVTPDKLRFKGMQIITDKETDERIEVYLYTTKVNTKKILLSNKLDPDDEFLQFKWVDQKMPVSISENLHIPKRDNIVFKFLQGDIELDSIDEVFSNLNKYILNSLLNKSFGDKINELRLIMSKSSYQVPKGYIRSIHGVGDSLTRTLIKEKDMTLAVDSKEDGKIFIYEDNKSYFAYFEKPNRSAKMVDKYMSTKEEAIETLTKNYKKFLDTVSTYDENDIDSNVNAYINAKDLTALRGLIKGHLIASDKFILSVKDGFAYVHDNYRIKKLKRKLDISQDFNVRATDFNKLKGKELRLEDDRVVSMDDSADIMVVEVKLPLEKLSSKPTKLPMSSKFKDGMETVLNAVDTGNPRFELNGMLVKTDGGKTVLVGTDTRRLSLYEQETGIKDSEVIIPKHAIGDKVSEIREISFDENQYQVYVDSDNFEVFSELIKGKYPDYQRIIPLYPNHTFTIDTKEFVKAIGKEKEPVLYFNDGKLIVQSLLAKGEIKQIGELKVDDKGTLRLMADARYILDAIKGSTSFKLSGNESNLPFTIDIEGVKTVVMPITL